MNAIKKDSAWDKEYRDSNFVSKDAKPQADFLRFLKWLKKDKKVMLVGARVLDAGCGIGRNAFYLATTYNVHVEAFDFSREAITLAKKDFSHPEISFSVRNMNESLLEPDTSVDLVLDIMASFSLGTQEREHFLHEIHRVLKPGGFLYLRTLAKESDKNAAFLLKHNPGPETDTYIHPTLGSSERVFTRTDLESLYGQFFDILFMERKTGYQKFGNQSYKRNYWNVYLQKHA
jgi:SAM-dependent methyltransferase